MVNRMFRLFRKTAFWLQTKHICEDNNCFNEAMECILYDHEHDREITFWYCPTHSQPNGFCWYCGQFWGGVESFDFDGHCPCCDAINGFEQEYFEETMEDWY